MIPPNNSALYPTTSSGPTIMKGSSAHPARLMPSAPSASAPARPATVTATSAAGGIEVRSGLPCSSSAPAVARASATRLGSPHDQAAAEAHPPYTHVPQASCTPGVHRPVDRVFAVVRRDIRTEETADAQPFPSSGYESAERKQRPGVQPPARAPEWRGRHAELQTCHLTSWLYDPGKLGQGHRRILHVAQQVGEGQRVE